MRQSGDFKKNITIDIPKNVVEGSEDIKVSAVADLLGPTLVNLEQMIRLPTGCGEQSLAQFMPNLIVLQYLKSTRQLTPTIQDEAISILETAYQKQLSFKRSDGSFSPFGSRDEVSNVW